VTRRIYRDFDEFADSLIGIEGRFIPTARATAEWWVESASVGHKQLQAFQTGSAATFAGQGKPNSFTVAVPTTDPRQIRIDGHFLEPDAFILLHEDQPFTFTGQDVVRWAGVNIPKDGPLVAPEVFLAARSGSGPRARTALPYLDRLRWVTERAISGSEAIDFSEPAAALAVDEEIAICLTHVLERSMKVLDRHVGRPQFSRGRVIARTLALIEANEGQPLFVDDLCRATQVSERSLRNIFLEFFGVGPMRLLKVRNLREVRAALLRADPQRDTVTRVAAKFGIWDFALFTRNYKALFGESPSRTLRTQPTAVQGKRSSIGWLHYASRMFLEDNPVRNPNSREAADEDPLSPATHSNVHRVVN
jgi:AraC family ethanolamine operon transcriptional activator